MNAKRQEDRGTDSRGHVQMGKKNPMMVQGQDQREVMKCGKDGNGGCAVSGERGKNQD